MKRRSFLKLLSASPLALAFKPPSKPVQPVYKVPKGHSLISCPSRNSNWTDLDDWCKNDLTKKLQARLDKLAAKEIIKRVTV